MSTLLVLMLVSALMAGVFAAVQSDLREAATDRDQTQAYAAAHAGLEQMTAGLAELFLRDVSPATSAIDAVAAVPPTIAGFNYLSPGGGDGFTIDYVDANNDGTPDILPNTAITTGPFTGFIGLITPYTMTVTARSTTGHSEVRLRRGLQTVAVPVFQFGMFSESDLSIFAGGGFRFGGRVHTNGSLFVAAQTNGTATVNITFSDRITAVREVIRNFLSNGRDVSTTAPSFNNEVRIPDSTSTTAVLRQSPNMGSVTGMPGSTANSNWTTISTSTFKSYVRTGLTGARRLQLPLVSQGATPVDIIRRPPLTAVAVEPAVVFDQRYFKMASIRILLSDRAADITGLPTVTGTAPVSLSGDWKVPAQRPAGYVVDATHPPIARSVGPGSTVTAAGSGGSYTSPWTQVYVSNVAGAQIPASHLLPTNMRVETLPGVSLGLTITCEGKTGNLAVPAAAGGALTANRFLGCTRSSNLIPIAAGSYVRATVDNRTVEARVTTLIAAGAAVIDIPVDPNTTAPFSSNLIWMNNANGRAVPVTCQGYDNRNTTSAPLNVRRFVNCAGLTQAPATNARITTSAQSDAGQPTIGGFIKVEKQTTPGTYVDVTTEFLNLGIGASNQAGTACADPTLLTAILRIQRLRDNGGDATCTYSGSTDSRDWWPQTLYDAREGSFRDSATSGGAVHTPTSPMRMTGVMQYIALDVRNLKAWLAGAGADTLNDDGNGYVVYFSDRRGNHNTTGGEPETGEYGFEDHINSTSAAGLPDGVLQAGEDVNENSTQQLYGAAPWPTGIPLRATVPAGTGVYSAAARPDTVIPHGNAAGVDGAGQARVNKVLHFRRALKLINGTINGGVNSLPTAGLTVASENPVYVQGSYNAPNLEPANAAWTNMEPNVPAAVIADAVSLLSNAWTDARSFEFPNDMSSRDASQTSYRFGAIAGKGLSFTYCGGACGNPGDLFGTDGGAGNFFRLLEDWGATGAPAGETAIRYRGSIISLHTNRQAIGAYKFASTNNHIYNAGPRNFTYDVDFLIPAELPPSTPMFRDVNTLQFRQILRPNQ